MSSTVERNFSWFVKKVIGTTGLLAMGAAIAGCSLLKGFGEEAKTTKDAEWEPEEKTTDLSELTMVPADTKTTADVSTNGTSDGSREICCGNHTPA